MSIQLGEDRENAGFGNDGFGDEEEINPHGSTPPSHVRNVEVFPSWIRFGIPIYLLGTFGLLLASDLGSGVSVDLRLTISGEVVVDEPLLTVSIFNSVVELWKAGSYPLAILIVITSICWPYIKLALSMFAWVYPIREGPRGLRRRERLIEWLDMLGKWSFVDIIVLIIMMVAMQMTITSNNGRDVTETFLVPKWGFYGFVFASILSLLVTHLILHLHRRVMYGKEDDMVKNEVRGAEGSVDSRRNLAAAAGTPSPVVGLLTIVAFVLMLGGSFLETFVFIYDKAGEHEERRFSLISIGTSVPTSAKDPSLFGIRFIQAFYFILVLAAPLYNIVLFGYLYFMPMAARSRRRLLFLTEVTFAWGAIEVYFISAIFSVLQIPEFGTGVIDSGCSTCFEVGAKLLPEYTVLSIGAILNFGLSLWLIFRAHGVLYEHAPETRGCWC